MPKAGDIQGDYRYTQGGHWRNTKTGKLGDPGAGGGAGGNAATSPYGPSIVNPNTEYRNTNDLINQGYNLNDQQARNSLAYNNPNENNPFGNKTVTIDPNTGQPVINTQLSQGNQDVVNGIQGSATGANQGLQSLISGGGFAGLGPAGSAPSSFEDSVFKRLTHGYDDQQGREGEQLGQTLANRGIPVGSALYNDQMKQFNDRWDTNRANARAQATESGAGMANQAAQTLSGIGQSGYMAPNFTGFNQGQYGQVDVNNVFSTFKGTDLAQQQLDFQKKQAGKMGGGGGGGSSGPPRVRSPFGQ